MKNSIRNLTWKLNWYRQSELEGAMLLGRVIRAAPNVSLICSLTRHCSDEARHAWMWAETIRTLGLPFVRIHRSYQSFYMGRGVVPASLPEVLALTHVFEHRVDQRFRDELETPDLPAAAARTFRQLIEDEQDHLNWIAHWLEKCPQGESLLRKYEAIDRKVYEEVSAYDERIWDIPGLGEELGSDQHKEIEHVAS